MRNILISITLFFIQTAAVCQTPLPLGTIIDFEAYTGLGAATNHGIFTGDVGSDSGIISGFVPPDFTGVIHSENATTIQARVDLLWMYINLNNLFVTHLNTHAAAYGGGETVSAGIYSVASAGSLGGTITLDGGGSTDAVFIFKFEGAFTAGVSTTVVLSNGARAANVFWIANGAIEIGATSIIKGTIFSYPGAITLGLNCDLEGRLLASEGAITIGSGSVATIPSGVCTVPIPCLGVCSPTFDVLGTIENFILFTSDGAVANSATSGIVGNVGTNLGAISGFGTSTHVGSFSNANATTEQARIDLDSAYARLMRIPVTIVPAHGAAFGAGETILPGIYDIGGAASIGGVLTLDGQNNSNATFIIRVNGAISVAAQARVIFINGTQVCNVFWLANGAFSMGTFAFMRGTLIAHGGACTMGANGTIEGRMLSTIGAIGFSTGTAYNDPLCITPSPMPIKLISFTAKIKDTYVNLNWSTASETNNAFFNIERSDDAINYISISSMNGAGNSSQILNYSMVDYEPLNETSYYRLKQTDFNGKKSYSNSVAITFENRKDYTFIIYPNPNNGVSFNYQIPENIKTDVLIVVQDILGKTYYSEVLPKKTQGKSVYTCKLNQKLKHGTYLITATYNNEFYTQRLIVYK